MKHFIEKMLGLPVNPQEYFFDDKIPIFLKNEYEYELVGIEDYDCLLVKKQGKVDLSALKKHYKLLQKLEVDKIIFVLEEMGTYQKRRLIEMRIPFVVPNKQVYMPFLGMYLNEIPEKENWKINKFSRVTQILLLRAIYEKWDEVNATEIASRMKVSKMTVTRCFSELQSVGIFLTSMKGRMRILVRPDSWREIYEKALPYMRNPIKLEVEVKDFTEYMDALRLSGMSALTEMSMIADNKYKTYAMERKDYKKHEEKIRKSKIQDGEDPEAILEVWEYILDYQDKQTVDPLSLATIYFDKRNLDGRVEMAVEEMLREIPW